MPNPSNVGSARINAKERKAKKAKKRKGIEAERVKPLNRIQAIDALIEGEERNGKQKKAEKETGNGPHPSYSGPFGHLFRPAWIIWWFYSQTSHQQGELCNIL